MSLRDAFSLIPGGDKIYDKMNKKKLANKNTSATTEIDKEKSVEDILPFESIINNIIKINKEKYRIVSKTNAINIFDMDTDDQDTILSIFAEYNNGITKPYQIFIPSFKLDIRDHIQKLENRIEDEADENISAWIEDDINHQKDLMQETDIIDTQFYIIHEADIRPESEEKDFIKAKKQLYSQSKICSDELEGIGLINQRLEYQDIGQLLYYCLNPMAAGIQEPKFTDNQIITSEKVKTKKKSKFKVDEDSEVFNLDSENTTYYKDGSLTFKNKIAPYSINDKEDPNYIRIGSTYMTIYEIQDYPDNLPRLWAKKLYKFKNNIDISIHVKPIPNSKIVKELNKAGIDYRSALASPIDNGKKKEAVTMIEKNMEVSSQSVSHTMDLLGSGEESFFHFSELILIKAKSIDELNDICMEVENILGSFCVFRKCTDNMRNALWSVLPFGINLAATERDMLTSSVANSFPFTNFSYSHKNKERQFFLGIQKNNQSLIHFNPYELDSFHYCILGRTGAGKGMVGKKIIKGVHCIMDIPVTLTDPDGECSIEVYDYEENKATTFAESISAENIEFFVGGKHRINVFDLEIDEESKSLIRPKISYLKIFFNHIFNNGIEKSDMNKIDYSLMHLFENKGFIDENKDTYWDDTIKSASKDVFYLGRPKRKPPELSELLYMWENNELKETIGDTTHLANALREWTKKGSIDLFDGQTNVDFKKKAVIFNLKKLDKYIKVPAAFVLFEKQYNQAMQNPTDYKLMHMFEAHALLKDDFIGEYVNEMVKRFRKFGGMFGFDTQNVTDLLKTKYGPEIIKNCNWHLLMKQDKLDVDILQDMHQMTKSEALKMTKFNPNKGEGYLIVDGFKIPINVSLSKRELNIFTTNPKDLKKMSMMRQADN